MPLQILSQMSLETLQIHACMFSTGLFKHSGNDVFVEMCIKTNAVEVKMSLLLTECSAHCQRSCLT